MGKSCKVILKNNLKEITKLHEWVENSCSELKIPDDIQFKIDLALEELITNTISYGYDDDSPHQIEVLLAMEDGKIIIKISDDAAEFDPVAVLDPDTEAPLEERKIGGLGIHFVKKMMDSVKYQREGDKNIILLEKSL